MINIGDKVTFKNEKLNGVVTELLSENKVRVLLDDGFDIDINEIIRIGEGMKQFEKYFNKQEAEKKQIIKKTVDEPVNEVSYLNRYGDAGHISLITLPATQNQIQNGPVIFRIENNTDYSLQTVLCLAASTNRRLVFAGKVHSNSFAETESFKRNELSSFSNWHMDMLFYKTGDFTNQKPFAADVTIQLPDWNISNPDLRGINSFVRVQKLKEFEEEKLNIDKLMLAFQHREAKEHVKKNIQTQHFDLEMEMDLHWSEIADEFDKIPQNEILLAQLKKFHEAMKQAIEKKAQSIVLIHGVGEGKLKTAIREELKNYKGVRFSPANEMKYGLGATKVVFE